MLYEVVIEPVEAVRGGSSTRCGGGPFLLSPPTRKKSITRSNNVDGVLLEGFIVDCLGIAAVTETGC